ncbi:NAD-dependent epimerase/dehydratase family protein [Cystobacter fuscus]|uniref:NAD-dependent epimerase/dehydratase family protein n=1 Tax=Cystobacter fuscus TaxID=43 RepID=UPI002B2F1805|nr:NAD-dependent epimerase/dehydratase family protein [Cystobacter fuscus]
MELKDKVVLVTGASGFVGTYVARGLREQGVRVRALVRRPEARAELERFGVEVVLGDLTDARSVEAAVRGTQALVHCAVQPTADVSEARRVNVEGTRTLAQAALATGCERFVHVSTVAVYPLRDREGVVDESLPLADDKDAYSITKIEAEREVEAVAARGLRTVILRPPVILGVHPSSFWGTQVPKNIAAGQFAQVDEGRRPLTYVHVLSLVDAVIRALRVDEAVGQTFNISDGHTPWHRYTDLFKTRPLPSVSPAQLPAFMSFRGTLSTEKAQRVLGWKPRDTFDPVMAEVVRALPKP